MIFRSNQINGPTTFSSVQQIFWVQQFEDQTFIGFRKALKVHCQQCTNVPLLHCINVAIQQCSNGVI